MDFVVTINCIGQIASDLTKSEQKKLSNMARRIAWTHRTKVEVRNERDIVLYTCEYCPATIRTGIYAIEE